MKITNATVQVRPCQHGNHFNAVIVFDWSNNDRTELFCPTCFGTAEIAEQEGKKAIPVMTEILNDQAANGSLFQNIGKQVGTTQSTAPKRTHRDPNPNLH